MAKASEPGRTKTRLVPPLCPDEAAAFNTAFLRDVSANLQTAACAAVLHGCALGGYMAFGPPGTEGFFRETLPREIGLIDAWCPNFGDCLFTAVNGLFAAGHDFAVVLNSDSPTLPTALLTETAAVLARPDDRVVIGPSSDGGYYLLGIKRPHRHLFEDVDWSTDRVARQSIERAREIGLEVHELPVWYDVDDQHALRLLHAELFEGRSFNPELMPFPASHTAALMRRLAMDSDLANRLGVTFPLVQGRLAVKPYWAKPARAAVAVEPSS
jgi:rSAM/selenodomain-associated transferase 1